MPPVSSSISKRSHLRLKEARLRAVIEWKSMRSRRICAALFAGASTIVILITVTVAGCHRAPPLTAQEAAGRHLYEVRCAHCHEDNDLALKKVPPNLHHLFAHPTLPSGTPNSDQNIERVVLSGKGMMPSFAGRFTQDQMAALLAYLHTGLR